MALNILCTSTSYPPAIGGAQLHTHQLVRQLAQRHTVRVVTLWDHNRTDWLLGTTLNAPPQPKSYTIDDIPVQLITLSPTDRRAIRPWVYSYYALKSAAIRRIAARFTPQIEALAAGADLVHTARIGREPLSYASLQVARRRGIPFVFTPYHHPRWVGWNYRDYIRLYRQADALIALTATERDTLIELGARPERVFVTGNGPNLADAARPDVFRAGLNLPDNIPLVLFLGQKYPYKGFKQLAQAAPLVWRTWPEARFLFIGPRTRASEKFFATIQDPRLIELPAVDLQTKTDALAACSLLCLPSTQESFGGVFTEAWHFGRPVIGADIPAVREIIDDGVNGYVTSPTPAALAERIGYLLENPPLAARLGAAGQQKTARKYSWEQLAQKTEQVYTAVLHEL